MASEQNHIVKHIEENLLEPVFIAVNGRINNLGFIIKKMLCKDELKKILINSMVSKGKDIPVYLWKPDDEYIGLFMEGEDVVKLFRAKKEFEDLLIKVDGPYIEATMELQKLERKMFKR